MHITLHVYVPSGQLLPIETIELNNSVSVKRRHWSDCADAQSRVFAGHEPNSNYFCFRGGAAHSAKYGAGHGTIWMESVECFGHETSLEDCKVEWVSKECDHKRDVSVDCDFVFNQGIVLTAPCENVSSSICRERKPIAYCAFALSDQGLRCLLTELFETMECIDGE